VAGNVLLEAALDVFLRMNPGETVREARCAFPACSSSWPPSSWSSPARTTPPARRLRRVPLTAMPRRNWRTARSRAAWCARRGRPTSCASA
jgi:hypothetical protein